MHSAIIVTYKDDHDYIAAVYIQMIATMKNLLIPELVLQQYWACENVVEELLFQKTVNKSCFSDLWQVGFPVRERCEILCSIADIMMEVYPEAVAMYW